MLHRLTFVEVATEPTNVLLARFIQLASLNTDWRLNVSLIADLLATPYKLPDASKYTVANGVLYMICGVTFLTPGAVQAIFAEASFAGHDEATVRIVGLLIGTIGWLAVFGGLTGQRRFVAATVICRILFVPAVVVPLAMAGIFPRLLYTFAVLDPALAIGAWIYLSRDAKHPPVPYNR